MSMVSPMPQRKHRLASITKTQEEEATVVQSLSCLLVLSLSNNLFTKQELKSSNTSSSFLAETRLSIQATARGFLVILALCIHDLFEGIALGVNKRTTGVYFLLLAFASHKWVISATSGL